MKMKNLTLNFNYYEFLIMYENETSPTFPFIFIYLFFFKLCKHRSTSSKININFFFNNLNYSSKRWFVVLRGSVEIRFSQKFSLRNDELHWLTCLLRKVNIQAQKMLMIA